MTNARRVIGTDEERFMAKVEVQPDGCWTWTAAVYPAGYGMFAVRRFNAPGYQSALAHRWAYRYFVGEVPDGLVLDHICHSRACPGGYTCPHRRCVNPAHLEPVIQAVNAARGQGGQEHGRKTHCLRGHELTEANVYRYAKRRYCRTCRAIRRHPRSARLSGGAP